MCSVSLQLLQIIKPLESLSMRLDTQVSPLLQKMHSGPDVVKNLSVGQITTSSVSLNWTAPEGQSLFYRIEWKDNSGPNNITTNRTSVDISGLTAGTQYVFSVTAIAADNQTAGESANETQYTKPEKVVKMIAWQIGNSSLTFSWNLSGSASSYEVSLSSDIKNTSTTKEISFSDLEAGIIYNVTVISIAGPFKNTSDTFQFATKPNPPEVNNTKTTNESISLTWYTPHLSEGVTGISYIITYFHQGSNTQKNVSGTMTELSSLAPGERYNISLQTVGPQDLSSNAVFCIAYTLPNPISNLKASPESIMSVRLEWTQSTGNQQLLSYRVSSSSDPGNFNTTQTNYSSIVGLQPGTKYNFTVIPVIADNIGGPAQYIFGYTKPKKVDGLNATAINKTAIVVTWTRQDDYKTSYSYLVSISTEDSLIQNKTTANESIYFNNLTAGTHYTCKVITNVNNVQSDETTTKVLTKPEGASDVRAIGTTTNMTVTWKGPSGISSSYNIKIFNSSDTLIDNQTVKSNQSVKFLSLRPGQVYTVKVIILSGPFQEESGTVKNATFPNPPRNIKVLDQTTTSISISWELPLNMVHGQYNFTVFQNSKLPITTDNTQQDITNLTSGKQYNISVATVGPKGYLSTPVTVTTTTRPLSVSQLQGLDITTSGLTLTWGQPEPQQGYSYFIMVQYPNGTLANQTTSNTSVSIEGLQSGSNHTFTVTTQTADGTAASLESLLSLFTRPFPIRNLTAVTLNTTTIFLNWSKPQEFQENFFYGVETTGFNFAMNQSENSESAYVTGLKSGSNYSFMVYSKAANGIEGEPISTSQYTMPNKPGHITIKNRTTNSIFLNWGGASGTGTGSFSYRISYQSTLSNAITKDTPSTEVSLTGLESGTPYNISVTTVGPMNFTSEAVFIHLVTTKPESVRSLNVSSTFQYQIDLQWEAPTDKKFEYRYRVMAPNNENITKETNETSYQLKNLYPGTNYTFSVTTLAFDRTEGNQKSINVCTDMAPVSNLTCVGPDRENPILTLKWTEPRGENQEFWVQSNKTSLDDLEKVKSCCSHNLTNLSYNRMYEVKVWTLGCGKNTSVTEVCMTGITAPDVPNLTYVTITGKEHDKFTLQLNPSLFNDTKCPIVNYSVLVTSAEQGVHDEGQSSLHKYLNKTYDDWKKGSTSTYLAVIKAAENLNRNTGNSPLHVVIGDGTKSNLYNNGPLKASGSYSFALVTFTRLDLLNNGLVSVENSIFSISSISPESINLPVNPVVIGGAVGGTIAALVILVIAVIIAVVIFKRWSKGESSEVPIYSIRLFNECAHKSGGL
ncbi:hypothetical protein JZ751_020846 [Albula glossodonta]|uniref:protein-tyrosine-phosphatase n=1 Tax=Albula glossodonta TaxID=121402 RepID=A0A8T2PN52_9TELE|nr:hypothetical protein JZ751_020846 [Albula glossodonta]